MKTYADERRSCGCIMVDRESRLMLSMLKRLTVAILLVAAVIASSALGQNAQTSAIRKAEDELVPIQKNGLWGYADQSGKIIIKPNLHEQTVFQKI